MTGPPLVDAGPELIGREHESGLVDALVDRLREGGAALVVRGEAGIGKSALLSRVRRRAAARGVRSLITVGVESEAALGLGADVDPDPFRVAVAAFQLICEVADSAPLVLIVDDAHWLDRSSLGVLAFVARRLEAEPVALVAAIRTGQATPL